MKKPKKQNKKWNSEWILDYDPDFKSQNCATTQEGVKLPVTMQTTLHTSGLQTQTRVHCSRNNGMGKWVNKACMS